MMVVAGTASASTAQTQYSSSAINRVRNLGEKIIKFHFKSISNSYVSRITDEFEVKHVICHYA